MKKLRVGVVGVGYLGNFHAQKYAALSEAELVGIVDIDEQRVQQHQGEVVDGHQSFRPAAMSWVSSTSSRFIRPAESRNTVPYS